MNRSDRTKREAEREARRARRLADRAEQRAQHKAEQAARATKRAEDLAERAKRKSPRQRNVDRNIEDFVDNVTEKWTRKAEDWIEGHSRKLFDDDANSYDDFDDQYDDGLVDDSMSYGSEAAARKARVEADRASQRAAEAEARVDRNRAEDSTRARRQYRSRQRRSRVNSEFGFRGFSRKFKRVRRSRNLYRDKQNKKICGVCAGIADYWGMPVWRVRLIAVFGLFFAASAAVPAYFIAYFLMDEKPYYKRVTDRFHELDDELEEEFEVEKREHRERQRGSKSGKASQSDKPGVSSAHLLSSVRQKFSNIEDRLRMMESHVTSPKFELQRELRKIAGED